MTDSRGRKFDAVIVWKLDRFGRSVANFVKHMEDLRRAAYRTWGKGRR
jgi:DNA invertase Pin-like site-specific DNA recombinase